jgi:hypothetical protein
MSGDRTTREPHAILAWKWSVAFRGILDPLLLHELKALELEMRQLWATYRAN